MATPQSMSQIGLIWDASSDNVGVAKYQAYRNEFELRTSLLVPLIWIPT